MSAISKFDLKIKDHIQSPERKREYNEQHFSEAASCYDFATRAMSFGCDARWKRQLVDALPKLAAPVCVDLACGTGDIAFLLAEKYPDGQIVGIDLTEPMLELARKRNPFPQVEFRRQDMGAIELEDGTVDIVTGSYAVRNAADLGQALSEIHRILKSDGIVALLDFSKPPQAWFQRIQYLVLKYWCGLWGTILHGNPEVHAYIAASLKAFPDRQQLHNILQECGFEAVGSKRYFMGTLEQLALRKTAVY